MITKEKKGIFLSFLAVILIVMIFSPIFGEIAASQDAKFCQILIVISFGMGLVTMYVIQWYEKR